jgi:hypothetical protein
LLKNEHVTQFKSAVAKLSTKQKNTNTIEGMLNARREEHFKRVNSLRQSISKQDAVDLTGDLVRTVHNSAAKFLNSESVAEWLDKNELKAEQHVQRLEKALGLTLQQLRSLYEADPSTIESTQEARRIVELCDESLRVFEREFTNALSSSGGDIQAAQKVAVTSLLWKIQKKLLGEQHTLEDQGLEKYN